MCQKKHWGRLYIERRHPATLLSLFFMVASALLRIIYYAKTPMTPTVFWVHYINVIGASVVFVLAVTLWGHKYPQLTVIPVVMGVAFFMVKAFTFATLTHTVLCLILYTAVLVLYSLTVFEVIPTKYLLYPLFGLPLLYHIFVEDMQIYILADPPPPFFEWLPELSVLSIMAALLCLAVGMKHRPRSNL